MASDEPDPTLAAVEDATHRAEFLNLIIEHQEAIASLIYLLSRRERFARTELQASVAAMNAKVREFENTAEKVADYADGHIGIS